MKNPAHYWTMKFCLAALAGSTGLASAALTHQYTFEDGTFTDAVGGSDGSLEGGASISNGVLNLSGGTDAGILDAAALAIHTYANATVEFWATPNSAANTGYSALLGIGNVNSTDAGFAANYLLLATHRGDDVMRAAISISDDDSPWNEEQGVNGPEVNDDALHHYVVTVSDVGTVSETLTFYFDGVSLGSVLLTGDNTLGQVGQASGTQIAQIGDLYPQDTHWVGTVEELNFYDSALSESEVLANFVAGPVPEPSVSLLGGLGALALLRRRRTS